METTKVAVNVNVYGTLSDIAFFRYKRFHGYNLKSYIAYAYTTTIIDSAFIKGFCDEAMKVVISFDNSPKDENNLMVCFAVLSGRFIEESAIKYAKGTHVPKLGQRVIPIVYDLDSGEYHSLRQYGLWGIFHSFYYRRIVKELVLHLKTNNFKLFGGTNDS